MDGELCLKELDRAIVDTADALGVIDRLLDKMAKYLNRKKIRKLESKIDEFERHAERLDEKQRVIQQQLSALEGRISSLNREKRQFKGTDVLTLGAGYLARRGVKSLQQSHYEAVHARRESKIEKLRTKADRVRTRISEMETALDRLRSEANPSLLARILRWFQLLKNIVSSVVNLVVGNVLRSLAALGGAYAATSRM